MLPEEKLYPACEIYSHPEIHARPAYAAEAENNIAGRPARRAKPPRRGVLPIGKTQFERLRSAGQFPEPDHHLNGRPLWSGKLLSEFLGNKNGPEQ